MQIIDGLQNTIDQDPDVVVSADVIDLEKISTDFHEQFYTYFEKIESQLTFNFTEIKEIRYPKVYLNSILSNLISNSIKYTSSDQPLMIKIIGRKHEDKFELIVEDNGIGIDLDKNGGQLFKAFTRSTKQGEGKGMGLNIVHHIITKNGGEISVKSVPGEGTTFYCYLKEY